MDQIQLTGKFFGSGQFTPFSAADLPGAFSLSVKEKSALAVYNVATPESNRALTFENVAPQQVLAQVQDILGGQANPTWIRQFTIQSFDSYTDGLADVAASLRHLNLDCVLVPLRGGLKPRQVLDGMLNHTLVFEEFGFTNHTDPTLIHQYETELRAKLSVYVAKNPNLRLGVLDAAIGGDGANHLAKLLRQIRRELGGSWTVVFHMLYVPRTVGSSLPAVADKSEPGFSVRLKPFPVHHLIVEDWAPGMGIIGERNDTRMLYKPSVEPGAVFVVDVNGHGYLAVSDRVCDAVDKLISHLGTQRLSETRTYELGKDVYEENQRRFDRA